ncbi:PAS domain-containing protein [Piscinibacter sp. HJYY11]|uniref:PAS domain-containing protein n=1 Tax=Piscinibacter sp. HJYY11 TaxID=2801333 RepID=UPI00191D39C5|nr:PAS domain-containing protein [Piscinibacter sp. HJYY11]MBL0727443.1 PAS domain-containing protein [Piscinibacter sp. HJYY11]
MALPPAPPTPPSLAAGWAAVLDASSDALALLEDGGRLVWANAGFGHACGQPVGQVTGRSIESVLAPLTGPLDWPRWQRDGEHLDRLPLSWRPAGGGVRHGLLTLRPLGDAEALPPARWLLRLQDTTELQQLRDEAGRKAELLDMTQEVGRLAVWERDIPGGTGRWSRHMFKIFGLPEGDGTPSFDEIARRVHPDDNLPETFLASTRAAGRYDHHYRILLPDGSVRRVHSHWEVKTSPEGVPDRAIGLIVDDTEVYRLADAYDKANTHLTLAVQAANISVWRHDLKLDRFFYNDLGFRILGVEPTPDGISRADLRALIHPDDLPGIIASVEQSLRTEEPVDVRARYRRIDGSWAHILTRRAVRRNDKGEPIEFIGVGLDITAEVERLRAASELAEHLQIAVNAAGVGVWSRAPDTPRAHWNEQMFRITGRPQHLGGPTREEWINEIVHPDDRAAMRAARTMLATDAASFEHECRIVRPDGEIRWLVNRVRRERRDGMMMVFGVTIDVTERVRAEMALRSVNERVALAARSVGMGTWEWDVDTGEAMWDEAMFRLRGMEPQPQALNAEQRLAMTHPDDLENVKTALRQASRNTGPTTYEFRVVWPDGTIRWLASRSTPAPDANGRSTKRIGVNWDVTESRKAEERQREHELALRESQAKSEFLSRMSHELRTPLNAVLGFAQLLLIGKDTLQPQARSKIAHIQSAGEHLLALIDDVLDLSSLESDQLRLDLQPVRLHEVLGEALPLVEALARTHGVTVHAGSLEGTVTVDRTRLRQMLINLLSNAIKYNRPQGRVTVTSIVKPDHVLLQVQDTGLGMTPEQLAHLFEPFNRLGRERDGIEGTGIGLAVVKALARRMKGEISVESQAGLGSTFSVRLPRADDAVPATEATPLLSVPVAAAPAARRSGSVLYIEDNPVNVLLVEELIRMRPGLAFHAAATGMAGVAQAAQLRPDLILIDIQLPDIDGFEVLHHLRQQEATARTPCIALSANAMPDDIERARNAGFSDYWTKPIDFANFLAALDRRFPTVQRGHDQ